MRRVKESLGGQTVTWGKVNWLMGRISIEVETGLSCQPLKDLTIRKVEPIRPATTTNTQNSRLSLLAGGMWPRPWMVELERKEVMSENMTGRLG